MKHTPHPSFFSHDTRIDKEELRRLKKRERLHIYQYVDGENAVSLCGKKQIDQGLLRPQAWYDAVSFECPECRKQWSPQMLFVKKKVT